MSNNTCNNSNGPCKIVQVKVNHFETKKTLTISVSTFMATMYRVWFFSGFFFFFEIPNLFICWTVSNNNGDPTEPTQLDFTPSNKRLYFISFFSNFFFVRKIFPENLKHESLKVHDSKANSMDYFITCNNTTRIWIFLAFCQFVLFTYLH